jgi:hypothetical protein
MHYFGKRVLIVTLTITSIADAPRTCVDVEECEVVMIAFMTWAIVR